MHKSLTCWLAATLLLAAAVSARAAEPFAEDPDFLAASAAFATGQYVRAADGFRMLLDRYPRHAWLQMLLADSRERAGQLTLARDAYNAALANSLDPRSRTIAVEAVDRLNRLIARQAASAPADANSSPFELTADQVAAMSVVYPELSRRRTPHFDIVTNNPVLADVLAQRAERIFTRVGRLILGDRPVAGRVELIVYPDEAAFKKAEAVDAWGGGGYIHAPQADGTIRRVVALYQVDDGNRFRSRLLTNELPHEMTHIVLREYFGYSRSGQGSKPACPLWLEEGLACANESDGGASAEPRMRELLAAQAETPLADMIDVINPKIDRPVAFYSQAASFTRFLRTNLTDDQMAAFLAQLKSGQKPSVALGRALVCEDRPGWLAAMEERWHKAVRAGNR